MFQPKVLQPDPDPWFVRELRKIDPDLRVVWGYQRYFKSSWVIERRLPPERYFSIYASLLESGEPRFVQQPIFDTDQPEYNEFGEQTGYKIVGYRDFDLAPEHEWVMWADHLTEAVLSQLKRAYAWERNHSLTRLRIEKEQEQAAKEEALRKQNADIAWEGYKEAIRATGQVLHGGQPEQVMEGTEL